MNRQYFFLSLLCIIIVIIGACIIWPSFHFQFLSDDWDVLSHANRYPSLLSRFTMNDHQTEQGYVYRPLMSIYYAVLNFFFDKNPIGYRVVAYGIHVCASIAVFFFLMRILRFDDEYFQRYVAAAAAAAFLLHPSHAEVLFWTAAGADSIATVGVLGSLMLFDRAYHSLPKRKIFFVVSYGIFALTLFVKEIGIVALLGMPLLIAYRIRERYPDCVSTRMLAKKCVHDCARLVWIPCVLFCIYLGFRFHATGVLFGYYGSAHVGVNSDRIGRQIVDILSSMIAQGATRQSIVSAVYAYTEWVLIGIDIVFAAVLVYVRRWMRPIALLSVLSIGAILPVLPVQFNQVSDEGGRYAYLPSAFLISVGICLVASLSLLGVRYILHTISEERRRTVAQLVFCVLSSGIVLFFGFGLAQATELWDRYDDSNISILEAVHQEVMALPKPNEYVVIVGLPDSYFGVQGFRNGIQDAYEARYGRTTRIVRIPVHTVDSGIVHVRSVLQGSVVTHTSAPQFSIADGYDQSIANQLFLKTVDHSLRLTGMLQYEDELVQVHFFRWHYDTARSDGVTIVFKDQLVRDIMNGDATIFVFDGERIVAVLHSEWYTANSSS